MTIAEAKQKLIDLAQSQVGYREGPNNYNKYADDPKVIQLYGWCPQNQPWCCVFANWIYLNATNYDIGSRLTYGGTAACSSSAQLFINNDAFKKFPEVGDQAFFYSGGGINHTGIVVSVNGSEFSTVEGNYSDSVCEVRHNVGKSDVAGFGRPCWGIVSNADADTGETPEPASQDSRTTLKQGMRGEDVKGLQQRLIAAGYSVGDAGADGIFGKDTFRAVAAFQEDHGIPVTGIANAETIRMLKEAKPKEPNNPCLTIGSKGVGVQLLQAALNLMGFDCGKVDGEFGPKTQAAVNRFKADRLLKQDGKADKELWEELLNELQRRISDS